MVAFQMNGLHTTNSCEGHLDRGPLSPFVSLGAEGRPSTRFIDEQETFEQVAAAHGMSVMDIRLAHTDEAREASREVYTRLYENGETEAFKEWRTQTQQLGQKTQDLLDEFYAQRESSPEVKLGMSQLDDGLWEVYSGSFDTQEDYLRESQRNLEDSQKVLQSRQAEMAAFTQFLRQRYFSQS